MFDNRTAQERRRDERDKAFTNKERLAWAKATLVRFPFRDDLRALINQIEQVSS